MLIRVPRLTQSIFIDIAKLHANWDRVKSRIERVKPRFATVFEILAIHLASPSAPVFTVQSRMKMDLVVNDTFCFFHSVIENPYLLIEGEIAHANAD